MSIALPKGYDAQVRPRSGLASKHDTTVLNAPETIDADYCGDIGLILVNLLQEPFKIGTHDLIAKLILAQYVNLEWQALDALPESETGTGELGSTSKK